MIEYIYLLTSYSWKITWKVAMFKMITLLLSKYRIVMCILLSTIEELMRKKRWKLVILFSCNLRSGSLKESILTWIYSGIMNIEE